MESNYTLIPNLLEKIDTPKNSIVSSTLYNDDGHKIVLFRFDAGQELSAHTAPMPAVIQILEGEARVRLGADVHELGPGALAFMPAQLEHGIQAKTQVVMLLQMLKSSRPQAGSV